MPDTTDTTSDLEILTQLNADFLASAQNGDVRRFEQIVAEDFMASLADFLVREKKQFLDMMAAPRPFAELKADEVRIRLLGDFAIIHAHMTFRTGDGVRRQGRYTDDWQRRGGKWLLVGGETFWGPWWIGGRTRLAFPANRGRGGKPPGRIPRPRTRGNQRAPG